MEALDRRGWRLPRRTAGDPHSREYLEDPDHLIAVTKGANRSKGANGPEEWRPPDENYWCQYATDWTELKMEWGLTMTQKEAEAIIEMLDNCGEPLEVEAESADGTSGKDTSRRSAAGAATATPTLLPEQEPEENSSVYRFVRGSVRSRGVKGAGEHGWRKGVSEGNGP